MVALLATSEEPGGRFALAALSNALQIRPDQVVVVVLATIGMYAAFLFAVRVFGARVLARMSTFDLVVTLMMGAIAGRVVLGHTPVLAAGVVALATLLILEVGVGQIRRSRWGHRTLTSAPIALISGGRLRTAALSEAHVTEAEVIIALRQAGVRNLSEVAYAIFEPTGSISVLRTGAAIDPALLHGVRGLTERPRQRLRRDR